MRPGGEWNDERVIVFTEYRDTQRWLYEQLIGGGTTPRSASRCSTAGRTSDEREHIKTEFQESPAR